MRIDLGHVTLNTKLDAAKSGAPDAPVIILSNSLGTNLAMWDGQIELLTRKYRVLRYDKRGHGGSSTPQGPYEFTADLVADVIGIMDAYDIARADWLGISMGAMTGMGLAIHHPERFGKLIASSGMALTPPEAAPRWDARIDAIKAGGIAAIVDGVLPIWFCESWRAANAPALAQYREMILSHDPAGYIACCEAIKTMNYWDDLPNIRNEMLFVVGSEDQGAAPDVVRDMAARTPGAGFVEIAGAAHIPNVDAKAEFDAAISGFLSI